jgi:hypothetical protein
MGEQKDLERMLFFAFIYMLIEFCCCDNIIRILKKQRQMLF